MQLAVCTQDLVTGIDQLERAYNLLAAIGADQTVTPSGRLERFMPSLAAAVLLPLLSDSSGGMWT